MMHGVAFGIAVCGLLGSLSAPAVAQHSPVSLSGLAEDAIVIPRLGEKADLSARLVTDTGAEVTLADLVSYEKPIVLNFGYYSCPSMCSAVLNGFLAALNESGMIPGAEFDLLTISIDPKEGPELAAAKKATYVQEHGYTSEVASGWPFLTGSGLETRRLAESVGWNYRWNEHTSMYDHPPQVVLLAPDGTVTRYLNALGLDGTTLRRGLIEASEGEVGSFFERVLQSCLTYDPDTGNYKVAAMTVMQIGGALTVLALTYMILSLRRRERERRLEPATS